MVKASPQTEQNLRQCQTLRRKVSHKRSECQGRLYLISPGSEPDADSGIEGLRPLDAFRVGPALGSVAEESKVPLGSLLRDTFLMGGRRPLSLPSVLSSGQWLRQRFSLSAERSSGISSEYIFTSLPRLLSSGQNAGTPIPPHSSSYSLWTGQDPDVHIC